jgi:peptide chain release factor subunit 1
VKDNELAKLLSSECVIFEPPKQLAIADYICDSMFRLDPILEMYKNERFFGVVLISGSCYRVYKVIISGEHVDVRLMCSDMVRLQKKQRKGGQSAARFGRIRQEKKQHYTRTIAEEIVDAYMDSDHATCEIESMLIAGPSVTKKEVIKEDIFRMYFKDKILATLDSPEINDTSVYNIIDANTYLFTRQSRINDRHVEDIFRLIEVADDKLIFGPDETVHAARDNLVETIITHTQFEFDMRFANEKVHIIRSSDDRLRAYHGMIGVKFFATTEYFDETESIDYSGDDGVTGY